MSFKYLIVVIIACSSVYVVKAQNQQWFWGFSINPQHSEIFNSNDKKAAKVTPLSLVNVDGTSYISNNARGNNGEAIIPNSFRADLSLGYRFTDIFSLSTGLSYGYQQQKYKKEGSIHAHELSSTSYNMENTFHLIKLEIVALFSVPLNETSFLDIGLGIQPSYIIQYTEKTVFKDNTGLTTTTFIDDGGYHIERTNDNNFHWNLRGDIFNPFNLEARAIIGLRWSTDSDREFFVRFTADHSLFDIENKSAQIERSNGEYVSYYKEFHTPYKWTEGISTCPNCEAERPPSYNFTAGIAIGVRFYLR